MAARKSPKRKTKRAASKKKASRKKPAAGRTSGKKRPKAKKKTPRKRTTAGGKKKAARKKSTKTGTAGKKKRAASLGRPRISADAKLDHVFQKDYQAREIFEFLQVHTMRELEEYGPKEIIDALTAPVVQTVQRIRKTLAMANRSLAGDRDFAHEFKANL